MRRRVSLLLAAVLAGSTLTLFGPAQPASAVISCSGSSTMHVTPGLVYPALLGVLGFGKDHAIDLLVGRPNVVHSYSVFFVSPALCIHVRTPSPTVFLGIPNSTGTLKGYCGHMSGTGALMGQTYAFVQVGALAIMTGHYVGVANIVPAPFTSSCAHVDLALTTNPFALPSGATSFLITMIGTGLNCTNPLKTFESLLRVPPMVLLQHPVGVHVDVGVHAYTQTPCTAPDVLL